VRREANLTQGSFVGRERKGVSFGHVIVNFFMHPEANFNGETCKGQLRPAKAV